MHNHKKSVFNSLYQTAFKSDIVPPRGLPDKLKPFWEAAVEHSAADHRCGRKWECACAGCRVIKKEIKRRNNMEPNRGTAWMLGAELLRALGELAL